MKDWPARQPVGMVSPESVLQSDASALLVRTHSGGQPSSMSSSCPRSCKASYSFHSRPHVSFTSLSSQASLTYQGSWTSET